MAKAKGAALTAAVIVTLVFAQVQPALTATPQEILSSQWVPGWGYRDELNASDIDYQNFWADNAGKILTMAATTGDATDASRALGFLESQGLGNPSPSSLPYYLPEVLVNSSVIESQDRTTITNRIVQLVGNTATFGVHGLAIGSYYAGSATLGYLGSDRILFQGDIYKSNSSVVLPISDGFSKRSLFETSNGDRFYLYLNATLAAGESYANVSVQVLPVNSSLSSSDLLYIQVFSYSRQFNNASLYGPNGSILRKLAYDSGSPPAQRGLIIPYSRQVGALSEDSVALGFNDPTAIVNDTEQWYHDHVFGDMSWIGIAYDPPANSVGVLSQPIYSKVYPLEHLDYHLVNDTAKYISSNPVNVAVSPPVSFGFISYGLALDAESNPQNATLTNLARGYWNYYYDRYSTSNFSTSYSRSMNLFAMAGFKLYGCNSTVESFTRGFVEPNRGSSIEERGWAAAALYQLHKCTNSPSDLAVYQSVIGNFTSDPKHFVRLIVGGAPPAWTYQYGEAASGLMLAGVPSNSTSVLATMNAVLQSNVDGIVLNKPFHDDLANTETLPAYMLSTWLFESAMRNATGAWISSLSDCNITLLSYAGGTLDVAATGRNGTLVLNSTNGSEVTTCPTSITSYTFSSGKGSGIPEFPFQIGISLFTAIAVIVSYILARGIPQDQGRPSDRLE
jgi:hypothetical protein